MAKPLTLGEMYDGKVTGFYRKPCRSCRDLPPDDEHGTIAFLPNNKRFIFQRSKGWVDFEEHLADCRLLKRVQREIDAEVSRYKEHLITAALKHGVRVFHHESAAPEVLDILPFEEK